MLVGNYKLSEDEDRPSTCSDCLTPRLLSANTVKSENKVNTVYCNRLAHEFWLNVERKNGIVYASFREGLIHAEVLDSAGGFLEA